VIPLEIITLLGSTLVGGIMKLWSMKLKAEAQRHQQTMQAFTAQSSERTEIRESKDERFTWTRRFIAITVTLSVFVLPKVAVLIWPDTATVVYGWTEWESGFLFFTDGKDVMNWHQVATGTILITPLDTHAAMTVIGLYFGGSLVGHK
jgi:hypothetical protein